ncbi:MAG TPA: DASS family sodium-coupled anion symporter [Bacteroidota bacterium]|nr:DASS family sodium-coupled anion symporter [Bacteroidota bacterium]
MIVRRFGFLLGLAVFALIAALPPFGTFLEAAQATPDIGDRAVQLASSMQLVLALVLLMVVWWLTEALPLPATALLPAVVLPLFHVAGFQDGQTVDFTTRTVLVNYSNPIIFLFLGGFLLAGAMQKWRLDRRFTLWFLTRGNIANDTRSILLGVMTVTAFLSMWISNTATAAMMLPLGLGILSTLDTRPGESRYGKALMLGIAWAASIGGVGTIIGTPPNGIALGILNSTFASDPNYHSISFLEWMGIGVPYVIMFIPLAWWILLLLNKPEVTRIESGKDRMLEQRQSLGPLSAGEKRTVGVFFLAVILWVTNPFWDSLLPPPLAARLAWIDEYSIGLTIGMLLFLVPVNVREGTFVLDWRDTHYVDWGTLLLFGGGIALSEAMFKTGLASWIAASFVGGLGAPSTFVMLIAIVVLVDFLTEITSNTAVTSMMVPIVISIALSTGENPVTLAVGVALAASMAFMLPVATPPNAIVYSSGYVSVKDMIRSGFFLDIAGWLLTLFVLVVFGSWILGIVPI